MAIQELRHYLNVVPHKPNNLHKSSSLRAAANPGHNPSAWPKPWTAASRHYVAFLAVTSKGCEEVQSERLTSLHVVP